MSSSVSPRPSIMTGSVEQLEISSASASSASCSAASHTSPPPRAPSCPAHGRRHRGPRRCPSPPRRSRAFSDSSANRLSKVFTESAPFPHKCRLCAAPPPDRTPHRLLAAPHLRPVALVQYHRAAEAPTNGAGCAYGWPVGTAAFHTCASSVTVSPTRPSRCTRPSRPAPPHRSEPPAPRSRRLRRPRFRWVSPPPPRTATPPPPAAPPPAGTGRGRLGVRHLVAADHHVEVLAPRSSPAPAR